MYQSSIIIIILLIGPCADYFALGITLHEMICGRRPFESNRLQSFRLNNNDSLRPVFVETTNYVSESCRDFIVALFVYEL